MLSLVWLRRDLRLDDNTALAHATNESDEVVVLFVFDTTILDGLADRDDRRVTFIYDSLVEIDTELRRRGSRLVVRHGDPIKEVPELALALHADEVRVNRDYEPYAKRRDATVADALAQHGIAFYDTRDHVIFDRTDVVTVSGGPYRVYSPYRRAWESRCASLTGELPSDLNQAPRLDRFVDASRLEGLSLDLALERLGFTRSNLWLRSGTSGARMRLERFATRIEAYAEARDTPAVEGTSGLSVHLRFGTISVRELLRRARAIAGSGSRAWIGEIVWRDFFHMILDHFPSVVERTFRSEFARIHWPGTDRDFDAWSNGTTGYPIVDAAMRHFRETGWMHNRLRMIVASFLVKDLLVDWRRGEAWFARHLLDYDLALNNGNWQWVASTGVDAQPYFRIFNPVDQSRRFDPDGSFIRRHLPMLERFSNRSIHFPGSASAGEQSMAGCVVGRDYPFPIVDHSVQRQRALNLYRHAGVSRSSD